MRYHQKKKVSKAMFKHNKKCFRCGFSYHGVLCNKSIDVSGRKIDFKISKNRPYNKGVVKL